jgi:alkanesulfonate monooxygenase SsuD/methylene tetrahydromethanopterin reductase-like flavin-dependent oxidoreductase (luciferase family)
MAAATSRLRLGTGVFVGPLRQPIALAKAVSTAAVLSHDRVVCGLGAGWMREEFDAAGEDFHTRGQRLDEITSILRQLWTGDMVEHTGPYYTFGPVQMLPAPVSPIPIWIGGNAPAAKGRAVGHDGWIGAFHDVDQAVADLDDVTSRLRSVERDGVPFGTATVGPIRRPPVLRRLAEAGYGAVIVPLAVLTRARDLAGWRAAIRTAVQLADEAGIGGVEAG